LATLFAYEKIDSLQMKSKERVNNYGEVFTSEREVNAMLNLVKQETERIESRFLEPACGTGNFLKEILRRKLNVVETRYKKSQLEYERNAVLTVSSIYGIDILEDNVMECRNKLYEIFNQRYTSIFKESAKDECLKSVRYILEHNIIWGDALTFETVDQNPETIIFSEWSPLNGSMFKRRDFTFRGLLEHEETKELPLFSDRGEKVYIPIPKREFPPVHFLRIADVR
jgi:hypothetical protein